MYLVCWVAQTNRWDGVSDRWEFCDSIEAVKNLRIENGLADDPDVIIVGPNVHENSITVENVMSR